MLRLIVNADDFGLTEKVNAGIERAFREGILTSTTLMANGRAFDGAVRVAKENPGLDVGVHLTLIEERPLLEAARVPTLVDGEGRFPHHASAFLKKYLRRAIDPAEVRAELEAQLGKIRDHGIRPSHMDSHQHVHMLPRILPVALELARRFEIPVVRCPAEAWRPGWTRFGRVASMLVLAAYCAAGRRRLPLAADAFAGFYFGGNMNRENLAAVIRGLPAQGTCELMTHPGLEDATGPYGHWGYHWQDELAALTDAGIRRLLDERSITLINHRKLVESFGTK